MVFYIINDKLNNKLKKPLRFGWNYYNQSSNGTWHTDQNLNKYVFTLAQFKNIIFSNQVQGIEVYKKKYPLLTVSDALSEWDNLSTLDKDEYIDLGNKLTDELDKFPTFIFPDIITQPPLQELVNNQTLNLTSIYKLNTGLHKFVINEQILFHIYYDFNKNEYLLTSLSSLLSEDKDTIDRINIYFENESIFIQNKLEDSFTIKKYSNYI
jgi:hypothetical protein